MLKLAVIVLVLLSPSPGALPLKASAAQSAESVSDSRAIASLKYCELIESSRRYSGKPVRVSATWQFGFETTFLFDRECPKLEGAWLEFTDDERSCPETKKNRDAPGPHDKEAEVTATGRLIGPGRYGHLGAYQYKFVVTCLEKIKITASDLK